MENDNFGKYQYSQGDQYIEVAVALPVNQTFTYKVPEYLANSAVIGMRVLVPFGRRRITGYIVSKIGKREDSQVGYKPKLILDLLDDIPLFQPSMVQFFNWISRYYIHPIGEVIKTALPSGLDSHDVALVVITEKGSQCLLHNSLTPSEIYVIKQLESAGGTLPLKLLTESKNTNSKNFTATHTSINKAVAQASTNKTVTHALINKMVKDELVEITSELKKDKTQVKMEKFITISDDIFSETVINKLSKKRQEIIEIVKNHKEISLTALKKDVPTAPKLVPIMAEDGYLTITLKQVFRDPFGDTVDPDIPPKLTDEQAAVVNQVKEKMEAGFEKRESGFQRYLLTGVTGSGKTEVYMRLVTEAVNRGRGAIILVPEISLISQTERRFRARFGKTIAVIHSGLSRGELLDQWYKIAKGEVSIVIGARSAIFAPVDNLGIIIVDEEHDTSYKQETGLRYNARDLALVRGQQNNITVILGSATPSIQSYYNACNGKFQELFLKNRVNRHPLPEITLVDLKKYKDCSWQEKLITPELSKAILDCLKKGEQALIFLNRRGFSTFPVCESCGEALRCKFCDITLTLHKDSSEFRCHLCGFSISSTINTASIKTSTGRTFYKTKVLSDIKCQKCGSTKIKPLGFGTERIENLLKDMFSDARIIRLDQDTGGKKGATVQILKKVKNRTVDIIVGTQMLAKGHDFPAITLVGVICADLSLNFPDFRAGERTFQLLAQVAGRAGRGDKIGKVIMQTYNPDHFSIEASKNQDFVQFYYSEIPFRQALSYPPFSRIIQLKISGFDIEKVKAHAILVGNLCKIFIDGSSLAQLNCGNAETANQDSNGSSLESCTLLNKSIEMLGPIEAGIPKISMRYRWQILLKSSSVNLLNRAVQHLIEDKRAFSAKDISVGIDVDPYFMM
ncbi:MAG: primosomal protein N' [Desulfamplus sp.]|nr:primosomal protein N' [Desulfamplus sp.]